MIFSLSLLTMGLVGALFAILGAPMFCVVPFMFICVLVFAGGVVLVGADDNR